MKTSSWILIGIFVIYLIANFIFINRRDKKLETINNLYKTSQDSLKLTRNSLNQQIATNSVLESDNAKFFYELESKDKTINWLQIVVKNYEKKIGDLNTAIVVSNETIITLRDSLHAIIVGHTEDPVTPGVYYPIYQREFSREWDSGKITMGLDTLDLVTKVKNKYEVTIGSEKTGLFKRKDYANITNLNPNTDTKEMKVFQEKEVKTGDGKKIGIGAVVGFIIAVLIL